MGVTLSQSLNSTAQESLTAVPTFYLEKNSKVRYKLRKFQTAETETDDPFLILQQL